jgi:hypothetical protein
MDPVTHKVTRRIKHFSGYVVSADDVSGSGLEGSSASANRRSTGWLAVLKRSGNMLASG